MLKQSGAMLRDYLNGLENIEKLTSNLNLLGASA
jgi:hypothetical protein